MKRRFVSVVIPVYNERQHVTDAIRAVEAAVAEAPSFQAELVVVDDGSSDGSAEAAASAATLPVRLVRQPNRGRFAARQAGLEAAEGDYVLFVDSRVALFSRALRFLAERLDEDPDAVWNAHCVIATNGNPYGHFWNVVTELAFSSYFSDPRTTSFDAESFDHFPKGTTCFFAPRETLHQAFAAFQTYYGDSRYSNDDTVILRWIAEHGEIHISPEFACVYRPRASLVPFLRHAYHRGIVFLDGHGHRESRFFPAVVMFYPASIVVALLSLRRPLSAPVALGVVSALAAILASGKRSRRETASFVALAPIYGLAHGVGMWRGAAMAAAERARQLASQLGQ
jgi:hypothetical protein